jgi:hypothetical protein
MFFGILIGAPIPGTRDQVHLILLIDLQYLTLESIMKYSRNRFRGRLSMAH